MSRDPRSEGAVVAGLALLLIMLPILAVLLFMAGAVAVVLGVYRIYIAPRLRRQRPVVRAAQVPAAFAAIAESMPELHNADRHLTDLYLIPDHAQEV